MGLNILALLIFILVLILVLCIVNLNRFGGKECHFLGGHFSELYSNKTNTIETLVTMDIKLPHISEDIHISPTINKNANSETFEKAWAIPFHKYANPLPSDINSGLI